MIKVDTDKPPSLLLLALGFIVVIVTWTVSTVFLSVNSTSEGFNITTTFVAMAIGYFLGTFGSSILRSDSSIKTFFKKPSEHSWLYLALFFQNTFSSISWVLWALVCAMPTSDVTILTALLPLHLLIPFAFGVCYLKEQFNRAKGVGVCLMIASAMILSTDVEAMRGKNDKGHRMPLTSLVLYTLSHFLWGFNYVSIGVFRKFHVSLTGIHMHRSDFHFTIMRLTCTHAHQFRATQTEQGRIPMYF